MVEFSQPLDILETSVNHSIGIIAIMVLLSGCGASNSITQRVPAGHQSSEKAAVLEAVDRYMIAISESDYEAQEAMQTPDGMTYQWRPTGDDDMHITAHPNSYWSDPSREEGHVFRERYWSPTVLIRGGIAVVWAPYEFWVDGETTHCGVDVLDFVKIDGEWIVSNAMWTVEPGACTELRPVEGAKLRPKD